MKQYRDRKSISCLLVLANLSLAAFAHAGDEQDRTATRLVEQFETNKVFWQQFEIAKKLVILGDTNVLPAVRMLLSQDDRHLRCNAAFVVAGLGHNDGFDVISAVLTDRSDRVEGQGIPGGRWSVRSQIAADRYYAAHMLAELKDPRAISVLVPLLRDEEVNYKVAWALGEIADRRAIKPLMESLTDKNSDVRVLAIQALEKLGAEEALPKLRALLGDKEKAHFGDQLSVSEAAKTAIAKLEKKP